MLTRQRDRKHKEEIGEEGEKEEEIIEKRQTKSKGESQENNKVKKLLIRRKSWVLKPQLRNHLE
jgi:hypothetical protein